MGFKDTLAKKYADSYLKKYGDRITQVQGRVLSVKINTKRKFFIRNIITVDVLVKPDNSKTITRCQYIKKRWFKKPTFMQLSQGHSIVIQGIKGKKGKEDREIVSIINVMNLTTKQDLVKTDQTQAQRIKRQIVRK